MEKLAISTAVALAGFLTVFQGYMTYLHTQGDYALAMDLSGVYLLAPPLYVVVIGIGYLVTGGK